MKVWLPPSSWERRYGRFLKKTIEQSRREFLARLGHIIRLQRVSTALVTEPDVFDDTLTIQQQSEEITAAIATLFVWWQLQRPIVRNTIRGYFSAVNIFNDNQFRAVVKDISKLSIPQTQSTSVLSNQLVSPLPALLEKFGNDADVYREEPYLSGIEDNFVNGQETFIDRAITDVLSTGEQIVRNAIVTSATASIVRTAIDKVFENTGNRVRVNGGNQLDKLDISLSAHRQQSLGAKEYVWATRRDNRVRGNPNGLYPDAVPSHFHRDFKIFNWSRPPEGGHPGEAPGCRCRALMFIPN